jgi:hypothetical protein
LPFCNKGRGEERGNKAKKIMEEREREKVRKTGIIKEN